MKLSLTLHNKTFSECLPILLLIFLSAAFLVPLFIANDLHDPTRTGKIFFFARWMLVIIPVGLIVFIRNRKQPVDLLSALVLFWGGWILLRGKTGGIWHDEKFFWFAGCFVFFFLADANRTLNQPRPAETQFQQAANMVPHKFYPLYLLANLYNETGLQKKTVVFARQLLDKEVKVPSQAIEEINEEMREVINSNSFSSDEFHDKIKKGKNYAKCCTTAIEHQFW